MLGDGRLQLHALTADPTAVAGRKFVADVTSQHGEIDHAVSCFGAWWQGGEPLLRPVALCAVDCMNLVNCKYLLAGGGCELHAVATRHPATCDSPPAGLLTEQSYDEFSRVIANFAGSHFVFAKTILPVMKKSENSTMLFITGGVGERLGMVGCAVGRVCTGPKCACTTGAGLALLVLCLCSPANMPSFVVAGQRVLSADSGLATVGGAAVYGVVRAAQVRLKHGRLSTPCSARHPILASCLHSGTSHIPACWSTNPTC